MADEAAIDALFRDLDAAIKADDPIQGLKIVDQILAAAPQDELALKCKIAFLITLNKFQDAVSLIQTHQLDALFELAYSYYRLGKLQDASATLQRVKGPKPPRVLRLLAQVSYRLEDHATAISLYEELIRDPKLEGLERDQLLTNLSAAYVASGNGALAAQTLRERGQHTYEQLFNAGCAEIHAGNLVAADALLNHSLKECRSTLAQEGLTEDEIDEECASIQTQLAYVRQRQGAVEEATSLYRGVLDKKPDDVAVVAVANNNLIAARGKHDKLLDAGKKLALTQAAETKLTSAQREAIAFNRCLVLLYTSKQTDECLKALEQFRTAFPASDRPVVVQAALALREKKQAEAVSVLQEWITRQPRNALNAALVLAQVHVNAGATAEAVRVLKSLPEANRAGVVGTIVALCEQMEDIDAAVAALDAASHGDGQEKMIAAKATYKLKRGQYTEAAKLYQQLLDKNPEDLSLTASFVTAASHFNADLAEREAAKLPEVPVPTEDANALELVVAPKTVRRAGAEKQIVDEVPAAAVAVRRVKKHKKRIRYPKNFDPKQPGPPPDPERWIKLQERAAYRKRSRRHQEKQISGKGVQGAVNQDQAAKLAAAPLPEDAPKPAPAPTPSAPKGKPKRGGGGKKKGRW